MAIKAVIDTNIWKPIQAFYIKPACQMHARKGSLTILVLENRNIYALMRYFDIK